MLLISGLVSLIAIICSLSLTDLPSLTDPREVSLPQLYNKPHGASARGGKVTQPWQGVDQADYDWAKNGAKK